MAFGLIASSVAVPANATALSPHPALGAAGSVANKAAKICSSVPATVSKSHEIDVVLDDSGSMFIAPSPQRWSYVKYALMVFAAMLGPTDEMKVLLLSQKGAVAKTIQGTKSGPSQANVDAINAIQMHGGGTPWDAVPAARDDLARSKAQSRWLVLLSDGAFDHHTATSGEFSNWSKSLGTAGHTFDVGYLGAGAGAPTLASAPGFHPAKASDNISEILGKTADLANQIFGRAQLKPMGGSGTTIDPDIELETVLVLAQGNAKIGTPESGKDQDQPLDLLAEPVTIPQPSNPPVSADNATVTAKPAAGLTGQVATVGKVPADQTYFDVGGASQTTFYYIPRVQFGVSWIDPSTNKPIPKGKAIVAGKYKIEYGFMDADCNIIPEEHTDLLGRHAVHASMSEDGDVIQPTLDSGAEYELSAGDTTVTVDGTYLGDVAAHAEIKQHIYPAPEQGTIAIDARKLTVSSLGSGAKITATYSHAGGKAVTPQEWAAIDPKSFQVHATPAAGIRWTVKKGATPGALTLTPVPSNGDTYSVNTSQPVHLSLVADYTYDEGVKRATGTADVRLVDDLSLWDRMLHWLSQDGWKWILIGLGLIILAGYIFKKRFSRRFKSSPHINARPRTFGMPSGQSRGEFKKSLGHRLLPFVADRATFRYAPGTAGFPRLKLKAVGRGAGEVTNWKALASAHRPEKSVEVNGTRFDKDMTRSPRLGAGSLITAQTTDMKYECAPNA
ncbi:vWA domain-containing protein [Pseudolysinimonas kribbensis]|uniref:vWA domain-containing protein n=1 Tax=Pseudolysinimonas kribbensis TaxID=433641 RepID=UPI0031D017ED